MNDRPADTDLGLVKEARPLDEALRALWQRVRLASELISKLRQEKSDLLAKLNDFEDEVSSYRGQLSRYEDEVRRLKAEQAQYRSGDGAGNFSPEEREALKIRIRELIAKINSHLE